MRNRKAVMVCSPLLLLATMGATDCQAFTEVTVPASDTGAPSTFDGVWQNNQFIKLVGAPNSFVHHLALGETVVAVSSAMDPGGVSKITTVASSQWTCCNGQGICSLTQPSSTPRVTTQPGDVGDTVSNGVWTGFIVSTPGCASGFTLGSFSFGWWTIAEDFHGNESTSAIQSIVYP